MSAHRVFTFPIRLSPHALLLGMPFRWPLRGSWRLLHACTRCVQRRPAGPRPSGCAKALLVCDLDCISPYTVFIRFFIRVSGRTHPFENNLKKFRTDFHNSHFFSFRNSTVKASSKPFYKCKHTSGLLSSAQLNMNASVLRVEDLQKSQTGKPAKMGAALDRTDLTAL